MCICKMVKLLIIFDFYLPDFPTPEFPSITILQQVKSRSRFSVLVRCPLTSVLPPWNGGFAPFIFYIILLNFIVWSWIQFNSTECKIINCNTNLTRNKIPSNKSLIRRNDAYVSFFHFIFRYRHFQAEMLT